ncbi:hypothetical protein DN068_19085 [Taibaiella soli]|uniref:Uncharacterized protein n=2 Tax=Taibaiella soli TaxID=1649169 RepID=A0A2W2A7R9_9BACT|nr:hypothetical protein DN068_19085 [Taibaiella soli]
MFITSSNTHRNIDFDPIDTEDHAAFTVGHNSSHSYESVNWQTKRKEASLNGTSHHSKKMKTPPYSSLKVALHSLSFHFPVSFQDLASVKIPAIPSFYRYLFYRDAAPPPRSC